MVHLSSFTKSAVNLEIAMCSPLTTVSLRLNHYDGTIRKTVTSKPFDEAMHYLTVIRQEDLPSAEKFYIFSWSYSWNMTSGEKLCSYQTTSMGNSWINTKPIQDSLHCLWYIQNQQYKIYMVMVKYTYLKLQIWNYLMTWQLSYKIAKTRSCFLTW